MPTSEVRGSNEEMREIKSMTEDDSNSTNNFGATIRRVPVYPCPQITQNTVRLVQPIEPSTADYSSCSLSDFQLETPQEILDLHLPFVVPRPYSFSTIGTRSPSPFTAGSTPSRSQETLRPLVPDGSSNEFKRDWVQDRSIVQLHPRDDKELICGWKRRFHFLAPILALGTLALYWLYFGLRIRFIIDAQQKYGSSFPFAWVFIAVEISIAIPAFMHTLWTTFILKKRKRPKFRLVGQEVPTVDILITCCGEDDNLVVDTVRAACDVDYPMDKFRVVVLDDGKSQTLLQALLDLRDMYPNLHYRSRPKYPGVPHHFKAGNLNFGLDQVHHMPGGAGEYVAALDADMIPEQWWLRALLPHLLLEPRMALACPPQLFYNVPKGDPLCQSLDYFVHVIEPIKDSLGVAWCTGSGYIARRNALNEIGGFDCGSIAEDVATSTLMLGKGWKTAYVHEALQFGTVPEDFGGHLKQRTRWAVGTVDTAFRLKFCLWGRQISQMTFAQRFCSFMYAVLSLFNLFLVVSLFAIPVVLIQNKQLIAYANDDQLRWLVRACFATLICHRLSEFVLFLPSGYSTGQRGGRYQLWMSPYFALTLIRSCLPIWLGGQTRAFKPTGSLQSALNERDPKCRAPIYRRLWTMLVNYLAVFHVAYVYFVLAAVVLSSYRCAAERTLRAKLVCLLTRACWPPMSWITVVSAFWIPITYACDPPDMPDREELLIRDPSTEIAHPSPESKKIGMAMQTCLFEFEYCFTTAFTILVFVAAFFF